jgi:phosphocarrier protein HPr
MMQEILQTTVTVGNEMGLHARVATTLVKAMQHYSCRVTLSKDGMEVNAGSVLGLLLLAATPGTRLLVTAEGPDAHEALAAISRLIQNEESELI